MTTTLTADLEMLAVWHDQEATLHREARDRYSTSHRNLDGASIRELCQRQVDLHAAAGRRLREAISALSAQQAGAGKDACEVCNGTRGGAPGNENRIGGKLMCDDCHADYMRERDAPAIPAPDAGGISAADEAQMALSHLYFIETLPGVHPHRSTCIRLALERLAKSAPSPAPVGEEEVADIVRRAIWFGWRSDTWGTMSAETRNRAASGYTRAIIARLRSGEG